MSIGIITKENIKKMQTALQLSGHYTGIIDGIAGDGTVKAVKAAAAASVVTTEPIEIPVGSTVVVTPPDVEPLPEMAQFFLSETSLQRMNGIKTKLRDVVKRAIQISEVDFMVNEGLRSIERQRQLVKSGASQTMKSNHLTGDAVDLVPMINGKMDWNDWDNYYVMATAMRIAAEELNIKVRWGGCWEIINGKTGNPKDWVNAYGDRKRKEGKKVFTDGPHFELA